MGARPSTYVRDVADVQDEDVFTDSEQPVIVNTRVWSDQQKEIFSWFEEGTGHLVGRARAGTGKTSTIIEGVNRAPDDFILLCAFNKKISEELNTRISNTSAEAKTLHALGFGAIRGEWGRMEVVQGSKRADTLTSQVVDRKVPSQICRLISQLHTKARDMVPTTPTLENLRYLCEFFDLTPDEGWGHYDTDYVVSRACDAVHVAAEEDRPPFIDYADMIFLPLVKQLLRPTYHLVVVDEAQDLSMSQLEMAQRVCIDRMCLVGDDKQAIYGFRGADSGSLDRLKQELGAAELPLTTTYRCAQSIVRQAQKLVPDIVAGPSNPEGLVDTASYARLLDDVAPGDFVLSRINAPLVSLTIALLRAGKRARMAGRDIAEGILSIIRKLKCVDSTTVEVLLQRLDEWERRTTTRMAATGNITLADRARDQAGMIRALAEASDNVGDLNQRLEWLFDTDDQPHVICSSVHKAKGLESDRVWVLEDTFYRRGPSREEDCCFYVAETRAKSHLTFVR